MGREIERDELIPYGMVELGRGARAFRLLHSAIAIVGLSSLGYVWWCAVTGRRDAVLAASVAWLLAQGVGMVIGRGNCPLGPLQRRLGDPTPLFELVLPPRAAKAVFPVLLVFTVLGFAGLLIPRG